MKTISFFCRKGEKLLMISIGKKSGWFFGNGVRYRVIIEIIYLSLYQYAVHKHQIDLYHTAFYYHNSLSV